MSSHGSKLSRLLPSLTRSGFLATSSIRCYTHDFKLKSLELNTCLGFWEDVPHGTLFNMTYIDTLGKKEDRGDAFEFDRKRGNKLDKPPKSTILTLHGGLGSHEKLLPVIEDLAKDGHRVICPNLPGSTFTRGARRFDDYAFGHTCEEYVCFIEDFLQALNVCELDMILAHSFGTIPAMQLMVASNLTRSAMFVNPHPHMPTPAIQPLWFFEIISNLISVPYTRWFGFVVVALFKRALKYGKYPVRQLLPVLTQMANINFHQIEQRANSFVLNQEKIPLVIACSKSDRAFGWERMRQFCELLGFLENHIFLVDDDGAILKKGEKKSDTDHVLLFEDGGHFLQMNHPKAIARAAIELLKVTESPKK